MQVAIYLVRKCILSIIKNSIASILIVINGKYGNFLLSLKFTFSTFPQISYIL